MKEINPPLIFNDFSESFLLTFSKINDIKTEFKDSIAKDYCFSILSSLFSV